MKRLHVIIAEAALELVPEGIAGHPSVRNEARMRGGDTVAGMTLLDRSVHHAAMLRLKDGYKRGRPDLVHLTLLSVTSTPLHQDGGARVYLHTTDDTVLVFETGSRPPKSYVRFRNLMEKVLTERPDQGLIRVREETLPRLLREIGVDAALGLSTQGKSSSLEVEARDLVSREEPGVVIGGFPKGHFEPRNVAAMDSLVRIHDRPLDAHVVAARVVYEAEKAAAREAPP